MALGTGGFERVQCCFRLVRNCSGDAERRIELGMVGVELRGELVLPFSRCGGKDHI